ncbi:MAG: lysophospholipid acyltransferase family protein [Lysobacteraceae bacterium]|nr:1-acyl-sn-glycerol-3-phosphate acyltransferase [Xanthomonadales bacterium]HPF72426.1 lysophospholipid acyltransferase family protein [Xanthomonadaceae bacterium]HRX99035.1 lysophospholipid acyltransferase family protein [Xanthomonadaceae bacterium]
MEQGIDPAADHEPPGNRDEPSATPDGRHQRQRSTTASLDWWSPLRYLLRIPLLLLHLLVSLPITLLLINPLSARCMVGGERLDHRAIRLWSRGLVGIFGMHIRTVGRPAPGGTLFVANHVSWIDIEVLHATRMMGFVAKSEISRWPLVGWLARRGGTIYHQRGSNESLSGVLHQMVQRLRDGLGVGVFPEGGTSDGHRIRTFHARIFQAAVVAPSPVQPVALKFGIDASQQAWVAFGPRENFLENFLRLLGGPSMRVEVHYLETLPAGFDDGRRAMAETCRQRIIDALGASSGAS